MCYVCVSVCLFGDISHIQFSVMDGQLSSLHPSVTNTLNTLLDPRMFSVDQGQLHILLHLSKK